MRVDLNLTGDQRDTIGELMIHVGQQDPFIGNPGIIEWSSLNIVIETLMDSDVPDLLNHLWSQTVWHSKVTNFLPFACQTTGTTLIRDTRYDGPVSEFGTNAEAFTLTNDATGNSIRVQCVTTSLPTGLPSPGKVNATATVNGRTRKLGSSAQIIKAIKELG